MKKSARNIQRRPVRNAVFATNAVAGIIGAVAATLLVVTYTAQEIESRVADES